MNGDQSIPPPVAPGPHCSHCGAVVGATDRFCSVCGTVIAPSSTATSMRVVRPAALPDLPSSRFGTKTKLAFAVVAIVGLLSVLVYLAGRYGPESGSQLPHDLAGTIIVKHSLIMVGQNGCLLPAPNMYLVPGALIFVRNENGETIATGKILDSVLVDPGVCHLEFTVPQIPTAREYRLVINGVTLPAMSHSQFARFGWNLEVRLNDFQDEAATSWSCEGQIRRVA
jgi:hypothetical protein